jgi:hypothetical protein
MADNIPVAWLVWVGPEGAKIRWPDRFNVTCTTDWQSGLEGVKKIVQVEVQGQGQGSSLVILVKASRGIGLDCLVDGLIK